MNETAHRILGIDWGTSNRRAYLVDAAGTLVDSRADDQGMLAAGPDFGASLAALLADMGIAPGVPVLASGMIGSAQGWRETPYLDAAVALEDLPRHLVGVPVPGDAPARTCRIVPGYRFQDADGRVDVMRGEEMQLLGAVAMGRRSGWFVLPGTHSKWVRLEQGVIRHLSTFMTGEFFATLGKQGTLAPLMKGPDDDAAFAAGVDEARRRAPLTHALFGVRARAVTGAMPAAQVRSFVSGLLIGAELVAALDLTGPAAGGVTTVAAPKLQGIYAAAAARLGIDLQPLDPDAVYRAALGVFLDRMDPHEASPL
ncbi:2-dehydro-3-deoxygalactonokinase [Herbaspirillum sp. SJZ107]|uniref:2-dehydro-3-deoxygalactonokinase n=1 Tax=Herbaspirillum sp. SJZ107 TaxID=2572881 RepID=UPI00114FBCC2|nr:2-dehydro-3-deoxygalactonokinase [Herbaspirillum sp. SJZ107]TQK03139.1 2-dehydro-3-deoxygalactonokinase [Herbaspirillum sp. SJZ107]